MKKLVLCLSGSCVINMAVASAQQYPYLRFVSVHCEVSYHIGEQMFYFNYTVVNGSASDGNLWVFEIDISRKEDSAVLDTLGLRFKNNFDERAFRRHFPALKDRIVPVGFPESPDGWDGALSNSLVGSFEGDPLVGPGQSLSNITMMSKGFPAIRKFVAKPDFDVDALFPSIEDTSADAMTTAEMDSIREAVNFRGLTVGPTAPPASFVALDFLDTIVSYKHQVFDLGWIDNQGIANSLDAKLDNAKKQLEKDNKTPAINQLEAFINEVEAQKDKHLNDEAFALLKYNAEYLIDRLEEEE